MPIMLAMVRAESDQLSFLLHNQFFHVSHLAHWRSPAIKVPRSPSSIFRGLDNFSATLIAAASQEVDCLPVDPEGADAFCCLREPG